MNAIAAGFSATWMSSCAPLALDVVCKATVLLSIAVLAAAILRRSSAAIRHRVWCLTFAGLLLLPALSAALPEWRLEVLPIVVGTLRVPQLTTLDASPAESGAMGAQRLDFTEMDPPSRETLFADPPSFVMPGGPLAEREDYNGVPVADPQELTVAANSTKEPTITIGPLGLVALWLLGAVAATSPLVLGLLRNYLLRRRAQPVAEAAWTGLLDELRNRLNLRRRVTLYETQAALMPMTWGMLAPIVMLPHRARQWTDRLRRFVLLHELAHVKRCDVGFQMLARLVCALYWFHPLVWYALRRLRIERELACDDCVVQAGERPSDYAAELLAIARNYRPLRLAAAVPMAQTSNLERRIRALFDKACSHLPISPRAARLLLLGTALIVTTIAVVRLAPRAAAEAEERSAAETQSDVAQPPSAGAGTPDTDEQTTPLSRSETRHLGGTVLLPDGQPAAGVTVYARLPSSERVPQIKVETDDSGQFRLALPQPLSNEQDSSKVEILVYAVADGFVHDWTFLWGQTTDDVVLGLSAAKSIEGKILNAEGRPLAGVALQVDDVARYRDNGMRLLFDDISNGRNILREYSHWGGSLPGQPDAVTTDADGRFHIAGISTDDVVKIKVRGSGIRHTTFEATAALRDTIRGPVPPVEPPFPPRPGRVLYGSPFEYIAEPARSIFGVVRDRRTDAPVPRAKVRCLDATTYEAETDELGRFVLEGCAKQPQYAVSIEPAPDGPAYFPATFIMADEVGLKPLSRSFELVEGVALRGQVVDSGTGRPLETPIHYAPLYLNTQVAALFEQHVDPYTHSHSEPDGSFRIVVAPGPGVLGIGFPSGAFEQYLSIGVGDDDVVKLFEQSPEHRSLAHSPELKRGMPDSLPTARPMGWSFISQTGHARMVLISPDPQKPPQPLEVRLVQGRTLQGRLIDPAGQPLTGATASGLYITGIRAQVISGSEFTVHAVGPDDEREISFEHQGRRLAAFRAIGAGEPEPIMVRLVPYGGATGRVVDEQGGPVEGMHVWFYPIVSKGMQRGREVFAITDDDGRFKIDELIPDQQYQVSRSEPGATSRRLLSLDKFAVKSGQTRDLGDLVLGSPVGKPSASASDNARSVADAPVPETERAAKSEALGNQRALTLRGRVLDPAGKPLSGARVRVVHVDTESHTWVEKGRHLAETMTNADGAFSIDVRDTARGASRDRFVQSSTVVLADVPGKGFDWSSPQRGGETLNLQLVDDAPVEGRILDLEGRPIAGIRVTVDEVSGGARDLDAWIEAAKNNPVSLDPDQMARPIKDRNTNPGPTVARYPGNKNLQLGAPKLLPSAVTGRDGSFRLVGLGRDRLVRLQLEGTGVAKTWLYVVTHDMQPVPHPGYDPRFRVQTCFGRRFDLTAEPEQLVTGVIRDADTGEPLRGVEVRLTRYADSLVFVEGFLSATTDEQGRYTLRGIPKPNHPKRSHWLRLLPATGEPYFRTEANPPKQDGLGPVQFDVALKRAIRLRGRVTDEATREPIRGLVAYFPFLNNKTAADFSNFRPGMHSMGNDDCYATDDDGRYEIPALPGRGAVVFIAEQADRYPEADGADDIAGIYQADRRQLNLYHLFGLQLVTALREVNLSKAGDDTPVEMAVRPLPIARLALVDPEGQPIIGVITKHLAPARVGRSYSIGWPNDPLPNAIAVIAGPRDTARTAMFLHRARHLAAALRLSPDRDPPQQVVLRPCATMAGRVVDSSGKPVPRLHFQVHAAPQTRDAKVDGRQDALGYLQTDADGRFQLDDMPPGLPYVISAIRGAERLDVTTKEVQPGETLDLGDVVLKVPEGTEEKTKNVQVNAGESKDLGDLAVGTDHPGSADDSKKDAEVPLSKAKMIRGRVARGDRPASGAHVAVIARRTSVQRGGELGWGADVLAEATANEKGEYSMTLANVSQQTHADATVVARQGGAAIAWRRVNLDAVETEAALDLPDEAPVRGQVIDVDGRPADGVRISVVSVVVRTDNVHQTQGVGYHGGDKVPAAWFATVTSDAQGRFVLHGLAANHGVSLEVAGDDRFAEQNILLNTGAQEQRSDRDRTYRSLVKNVKSGEEAGLVLAPAQPFEGTVRYADTGQGVPHARITIWASQEQFGSMMSVAGRADEQGHYRISPRPGIRFGVTAYPPDGAAYLARETPLDKAFEWKAVERSKQVDLTLPRGALVRGRVVEAGSETPVVGAAVQYVPESSNNPNASDDILTGWQAIQLSDRDGRFSMAVLPGPGRLLVNSQQAGYVLQEIGGRELGQGKPGGMRNYTHAIAKIDPQAGQEALDVKLELKRGETVTGRIVDEAGKLVDEALIISRLNISPYSLSWRGHTTPTLGGTFELAGLVKDAEYPVYFLDSKRRLGATEIIKAGDGERTVVLKPCGVAMLHVVDGKGQPVPAQYVSDEMVVTPGVSRFDYDAVQRGELMADADFIANVDRINHPLASSNDESGKISLRALIPGATYRLSAQRGGKLQIVKEFQVRANETLDLGEIVVERE